MNNQIIHSQGSIIEKTIKDSEGKLICARFFVYIQNGRIRARLLSFIYLKDQALLKSRVFFLSISSDVLSTIFSTLNLALYSINYCFTTVFFLGSKPRAPTFA